MKEKNVGSAFFDLQQEDNPANGILLITDHDIAALFQSLRGREPFMFELKHPSGHTLTIGCGGQLGVAQFAASNGDPPYVVTVAKPSSDDTPITTFWVGNELTEIPLRFCLPIALIEDIAAEFVKSGQKSSLVNWEHL